MNEQKFSYLTKDPENLNGHDFLRGKYQLPQPNQFKYGRSQGGISNIELEKLGIGTRRPNKVFFAKRILPKNFRDDPFAEPPPITENDIRAALQQKVNQVTNLELQLNTLGRVIGERDTKIAELEKQLDQEELESEDNA